MLKERSLIYVGGLMMVFSALMGCQGLAMNNPNYPTQTNPQTGMIEPVPWIKLDSDTKTGLAIEQMQAMNTAAKPTLDAFGPVTGGIAPIVGLGITTILGAIAAFRQSKRANDLQYAAKELHREMPQGVTEIVKDRKAKEIFEKNVGL
jgi:hypothetical protein